jgi:D-amino peptidase
MLTQRFSMVEMTIGADVVKVLISADMEGTCGVSSWIHVNAPEQSNGSPYNQGEYERFRRHMTHEVNAAIEGALEAGADEVIVNDSHDGQRNILVEELHPDARYISGNDKPLGMMQGVDLEGIGAVFFTGYHARAGTPQAPLAHTWTTYLNDLRFDGESTGEFGLNAAIAGDFGVPIVFVAGDEKAVAQTQAQLGTQVVGAAVKQGISSTAAIHMSPSRAQSLIKSGAHEAIRNLREAKPFVIDKPTFIELDFEHQSRADQCILFTGIDRVGPRTIGFTVTSGLELCRIFRGAMKLAGIRLTP